MDVQFTASPHKAPYAEFADFLYQHSVSAFLQYTGDMHLLLRCRIFALSHEMFRKQLYNMRFLCIFILR